MKFIEMNELDWLLCMCTYLAVSSSTISICKGDRQVANEKKTNPFDENKILILFYEPTRAFNRPVHEAIKDLN